jgi:hypothetical protein
MSTSVSATVLERFLVKEEYAMQKEIELNTTFGNKKEYGSLFAIAS